jgi:hypothetical protein
MTLVNGWTVLSPSADSRLIYVSAEGDNATAATAKGGRGYYLPSDPEIGPDPTNPIGPILAYQTHFEAAKKVRLSKCIGEDANGFPTYGNVSPSGFPDWVLLRRGDSFTENPIFNHPNSGEPTEYNLGGLLGGPLQANQGWRQDQNRIHLGTGDHCGRSSNEPAVITAWGDQNNPLPILLDYTLGGGTKHVRVVSVNFTRFLNYGWSTNNITAGDILIEDCKMRQILTMPFFRVSFDTGLTIRRCVVSGSYLASNHNSGMFLYRSDAKILIEECVFDKNGYKEDPFNATTWTGNLISGLSVGGLPAGTGVQPTRTYYDRNMYLSSYASLTLRGNIISRGGGGSSVQMREGGTVDRNLFIWNETALGMTHPQADPLKHKGGLVINNVALHDDHFLPPGGWGGGLSTGGGNNDVAVLDNNIVAHFHRGNNGGQSLGINGKSYYSATESSSQLMRGIVKNNVVYREFGEGFSNTQGIAAGIRVMDNIREYGVLSGEITDNAISMPGLLSLHGNTLKPADFIYSGNKFYSPTTNGLFRWNWQSNSDGDYRTSPYTDGNFAQWQAAGFDLDATLTNDFNAFKTDVGWVTPERDIISYMQSIDPTYLVDEDVAIDDDAVVKQTVRRKVWEILVTGTDSAAMTEAQAKLAARRYHAFLTFIQRAKANTKSSWDPNYTAETLSNYIREGFGKPVVTGNYDNRELSVRLEEYVSNHGPVASLVLTTQPVGDVSGDLLGVQPIVTLRDSNNLTTTSDNTTQVSVAIQSGVNGTLSGTTTVTVVNGVASFTDLVLTGDDGEPYVLRFSIASPTLHVDSVNVVVSSEVLSPTVVKVIREPVASFSEAPFSTQPKVVLEDSSGSLVSSDSTTQVTVSIISGLGGVLKGTTTKTAANGIVEFTDLVLEGSTEQTYVLGFSASGLSGDTSTVTLLEQVISPPPQEVSQTTEGLIRTSQYFRDVLSIDIDGEFNKSDLLSLRVNKTKMVGVGTQDFIIKYRNTILNNRNVNYSIPEDWDLSWSFKQGPIANPNNLASCFLWLKPENFVINSDGTKYEALEDASNISTFSNRFNAAVDLQALRSYNGLNSFIPLSFDGIDDYYVDDEESGDFVVPTNIGFIFAFVAKTKDISTSKENVVFSLGRENEDGSFQVIIDETDNNKITFQTQAVSDQSKITSTDNCYAQGDAIITLVGRIGLDPFIRVNGTDKTPLLFPRMSEIISSGYGTFIGTTEDATDDTKKKFFSHDLYEVVLIKETVDTDVTINTLLALEGYLAAKYKLQNVLPANHAYKNEPQRTSLITDVGIIINPDLPFVSCSTLAATATSTSPSSNETTETVTVVVENDTCQWGANTENDWITLSKAFGIGNDTFDFTVSANEGAERTGTITVTSGTATPVVLTIIQEAGVVSLWSPDQLSLLAWYDANAITGLNDNDPVTTWSDESNNSRNLSTGSAPTYKTNIFGDKPSVRFEVTQYLKNDSAFMYPNGSCTVAIILSGPGSGSLNFAVAEGRSSNNNPVYAPIVRNSSLGDANGLKMWYRNDANSSVINYEDAIASTISNTIAVVIDDGSSIVTTKDGGSAVTAVASYSRSTTTLDRFAIGALFRSAYALGWDGDIAEIVIVGSALGEGDRQKLEGYLAHKWGLVANLPVDHPYKSAAPTV